MNEQIQKPEAYDYYDRMENPVYDAREMDEWIEWLIGFYEEKNAALKERVAELGNRVMPGRDYYAIIQNDDLKKRVAELENLLMLNDIEIPPEVK